MSPLSAAGRLVLCCAVVGAALGVALVWWWSPDPPACVSTSDGLRACLLVYVVPAPTWVYVAFAGGGALTGLLAAFGVLAARRVPAGGPSGRMGT